MALDQKMLIYFMAICNFLRSFGIFYGHLVHIVFTRYICSSFGIMCQEKSGNPDFEPASQPSHFFVETKATLLRSMRGPSPEQGDQMRL
jgi:hypothetical protein